MNPPSNKSAGEDGGIYRWHEGKKYRLVRFPVKQNITFDRMFEHPPLDYFKYGEYPRHIVQPGYWGMPPTEDRWVGSALKTALEKCDDLERQLKEAKEEKKDVAVYWQEKFDRMEQQVRELRENNEFLKKELSKPKDNAPF